MGLSLHSCSLPAPPLSWQTKHTTLQGAKNATHKLEARNETFAEIVHLPPRPARVSGSSRHSFIHVEMGDPLKHFCHCQPLEGQLQTCCQMTKAAIFRTFSVCSCSVACYLLLHMPGCILLVSNGTSRVGFCNRSMVPKPNIHSFPDLVISRLPGRQARLGHIFSPEKSTLGWFCPSSAHFCT